MGQTNENVGLSQFGPLNLNELQLTKEEVAQAEDVMTDFERAWSETFLTPGMPGPAWVNEFAPGPQGGK